MSADYNPILDRLIAKSREGKITWKPTFELNTFIAAIEGEFTFEIEKVNATYSFTMKDKDDNNIVEITAEDQAPYTPQFGDNKYFQKLTVIYALARDVALDIPQKLDQAAALLDRF